MFTKAHFPTLRTSVALMMFIHCKDNDTNGVTPHRREIISFYVSATVDKMSKFEIRVLMRSVFCRMNQLYTMQRFFLGNMHDESRESDLIQGLHCVKIKFPQYLLVFVPKPRHIQ